MGADSFPIDLARNDAVYQNLSFANTIAAIPDCAYTRLSAHWLFALTTPVSLPSHITTTSSSSSISKRTAEASSIISAWILPWNCADRGGTYRTLDSMVSW